MGKSGISDRKQAPLPESWFWSTVSKFYWGHFDSDRGSTFFQVPIPLPPTGVAKYTMSPVKFDSVGPYLTFLAKGLNFCQNCPILSHVYLTCLPFNFDGVCFFGFGLFLSVPQQMLSDRTMHLGICLWDMHDFCYMWTLLGQCHECTMFQQHWPPSTFACKCDVHRIFYFYSLQQAKWIIASTYVSPHWRDPLQLQPVWR